MIDHVNPVEWLDTGDGVWVEHPVEPTLLKFDRTIDGRRSTDADYWHTTEVEKQFGPLTRNTVSSQCYAEHPADRRSGIRRCLVTDAHTRHVDAIGRVWTTLTDVVLRPGENGRIPEVALAWEQARWEHEVREEQRLIDAVNLPTRDTGTHDDDDDDDDAVVRTYPNGQLVSSDTDVDRRKITDAAGLLEDIAVLTTQMAHDLVDVDANPEVSKFGLRTAYERVYWLHRELGRIVSSLGTDAVTASQLEVVASWYAGVLADDTSIDESGL